MTCVLAANASSIALPAANPTNALVASRLDLHLPDYAAVMVPAALAATAATVLVVAWRHRRTSPARSMPSRPRSASTARWRS